MGSIPSVKCAGELMTLADALSTRFNDVADELSEGLLRTANLSVTEQLMAQGRSPLTAVDVSQEVLGSLRKMVNGLREAAVAGDRIAEALDRSRIDPSARWDRASV